MARVTVVLSAIEDKPLEKGVIIYGNNAPEIAFLD